MKLYDLIKTIFIIVIFLALWPSLWNKIKTQWFETIEPKNKIGILHITGSIENSAEYLEPLTHFFQDTEIKAILLDIDCAGGTAGASQAIVYEILQLKIEFPKPIITYSENTCASGAYHIASATDYIITTGSCIVGSIGSTLTPQFYFAQFLKNYNIETADIHAGEYKNAINYMHPPTEQATAMLQKICDDTYEQFYTFVASKRKLSLDSLALWGQGKLFTGNQAQKLGLVDAIGCRLDATMYIKNHIIPTDHTLEWIKASPRQPWHKYLNWDDFWSFDFIETYSQQSAAASVHKITGTLIRPIAVQ